MNYRVRVFEYARMLCINRYKSGIGIARREIALEGAETVAAQC